MEQHPIVSSSIVSLGYEDETLEVSFVSGVVQRFSDVPFEAFQQILHAVSPENEFAILVRGVYPMTIVTGG